MGSPLNWRHTNPVWPFSRLVSYWVHASAWPKLNCDIINLNNVPRLSLDRELLMPPSLPLLAHDILIQGRYSMRGNCM